MTFDPFSADFKQALAATEAAGWRMGPEMPLAQWFAAQQINAAKPRCGSDGFEVLLCIRHCVTHGLVAPDWLARAFNRRFDTVLNCKEGSWDEAFGKPYPAGKQLEKGRRDREGRFRAWAALVDRLKREPETAIDNNLYEEIGKPLGVRREVAKRWVKEAAAMLGLQTPGAAKKSRKVVAEKRRG